MKFYKILNKTRLLLTLVFCLLITACQSLTALYSEKVNDPNSLYNDQNFSNYNDVIVETPEEIFAINAEMKNMVENELSSIRDPRKRAFKLIEHIFDKNNVALAYSNHSNLTAIETYNSKTANCLSLTIMAYALAKEANLNVDFQDVKIPEYWVRNGQYNMLTGHVNLIVSPSDDLNTNVAFGSDKLTVDFDPFVAKRVFPQRSIDQNTVVAMYYNNKGAQALVNHNYNEAYAYFKNSTMVAPNFSASWSNLAVLYRFTKDDETALKAYRYALSLDNNNYTALTNLSILLKQQGKFEEVENINDLLYRKRNKNPYYHALLADEALYEGRISVAVQHYKKAILLDKKNHEFYFSIAKLYYFNNDMVKAHRAMRKAIEFNPVKSIDKQYMAKLNLMKNKES